jgi:hypothetical protein
MYVPDISDVSIVLQRHLKDSLTSRCLFHVIRGYNILQRLKISEDRVIPYSVTMNMKE